MRRTQHPVLLAAGGFALVAALGIGPAAAQESTPAAGGGPAAGSFPAAIYEGTCGDLAAEPTYDLADVAYGPLMPDSLSGGLDDATPMAGQLAAQDDVAPVAIGATSLDLNLTELFVRDHQYAVGVSDPESAALIACGNIGGALFQDAGQTRTTLDEARLVSGLREANGSGYGGVALIESPTGGARESTSTTVTVFLIPPPNGA
ncbi:MAG: hypothetical protein AVDCRST_MAG59-1346 [uncultured Thermomicrobiales bacterium]|uniref:Uncharacterized protein n=1 Tax=uncultured Thermomicrobiales bacterium TaxID=1645740 RepID=A0A6J4UBV1_9BACT|nr:MAG: hypothetical protein AVDCRST_MAG59-1346 [uncultured Thermomicrobiales bacterium]